MPTIIAKKYSWIYFMTPSHIICHYAEIGLKGKNRSFFEKKLQDNIKNSLNIHLPDSFEYIRRLRGRLIIKLTDYGQSRPDEISSLLKNIFGVAYFAIACKTTQELDTVKGEALNILSEKPFSTFRITARRSSQNHPYTSQKINEEVGTFIVDHLHKKVNLSNPEITCYIDFIQSHSFLYIEKIAGKGGLPVGVSGLVIVMLSGGIDSPVATYFALKRGAPVVFVHFHSVPYTTSASIEKVRTTIKILNKFQLKAKLILVEFAPIQNEIMLKSSPKLRVILYRRFMLRISEAIARKENAKAIVTGESLGQVASQTLENMAVVEQVTQLPVLRPLIGFDKQEIINLAKEIDTYEISIQPHQDCCTLFVPKHPATRARLMDVEASEKNLDVDSLVRTALETAQTEYIGI